MIKASEGRELQLLKGCFPQYDLDVLEGVLAANNTEGF